MRSPRSNQNKLLKEIGLYPYQNSQHIYSTLVTVFSKCHPKSSSSSLKLISNEMVLAVSIANQIVVFTSQILRDMAITLTPNSHTHPKPKHFFFLSQKANKDFTNFLFPFVEPSMAYFEFFELYALILEFFPKNICWMKTILIWPKFSLKMFFFFSSWNKEKLFTEIVSVQVLLTDLYKRLNSWQYPLINYLAKHQENPPKPNNPNLYITNRPEMTVYTRYVLHLG